MTAHATQGTASMNETWKAVGREAALAAEHMAIGATAIAKVSSARAGVYAQMFFALSVGFERSAKLALVIDHALRHKGAYPDYRSIRGYGHNLRALLDAADTVADRRGGDRLPRLAIHDGIIGVLSDFASNVTRYYNLDLITGDPRAPQRIDPMRAWYQDVIDPVLTKHYNTRQREQDAAKARVMEAMLGDTVSMLHHDERGQLIASIDEGARHSAAVNRARPYTRMYVLQIARFLANLLSTLGHDGYAVPAASVPHLSDFFCLFNNDDRCFRERKVWSIYRV